LALTESAGRALLAVTGLATLAGSFFLPFTVAAFTSLDFTSNATSFRGNLPSGLRIAPDC
jgi:hypothetical protein